MSVWTFCDFVDQRGINVIRDWLDNDIPVAAAAAIDAKIDILRHVRILQRPDCGALKGKECNGLYELRVTHQRVQYRPLFYYGPVKAHVTLLIGAKEKGSKFEPKQACEIGQSRISDIRFGRATVHEHV